MKNCICNETIKLNKDNICGEPLSCSGIDIITIQLINSNLSDGNSIDVEFQASLDWKNYCKISGIDISNCGTYITSLSKKTIVTFDVSVISAMRLFSKMDFKDGEYLEFIVVGGR